MNVIEEALEEIRGLLEGDIYTVNRSPVDRREQDDLPSLSVLMGDDELLENNGVVIPGFRDSILTVFVDVEIEFDDVPDTELNCTRQYVYDRLTVAPLDVDGVIDLFPLGTEEPEFESGGEAIFARQRTAWGMRYRTNA